MDLVLIPAVVAAVEFLRRVKASDWFAAITILVSACIGVLLGVFGAPGVPDVWAGLTGALAASGIVTVATRV